MIEIKDVMKSFENKNVLNQFKCHNFLRKYFWFDWS